MSMDRKIEQALQKIGGRFKLAALLERRIQELNKGAPRLVTSDSKNLLDVALDEILEDKIQIAEQEAGPKL